MNLDRGYTDPLLVSTYDIENSGRDDIDFYLAMAAELSGSRVIDVGCGTGVLAVDLAAQGLQVVGIDPAGAMLDIARQRSGADRVRWIVGDADVLVSHSADLVVLTGHVAQVFLDDKEWAAVLNNACRALVPGGHLMFETRNPLVRPWERWNRQDSAGIYALPDGGSFQSWVQVTEVNKELVTFQSHTIFNASDEHHISKSTLRFRTQQGIHASLAAAGFAVEHVYGDWDRRAVTALSRELIFIARKL